MSCLIHVGHCKVAGLSHPVVRQICPLVSMTDLLSSTNKQQSNNLHIAGVSLSQWHDKTLYHLSGKGSGHAQTSHFLFRAGGDWCSSEVGRHVLEEAADDTGLTVLQVAVKIWLSIEWLYYLFGL